MRPVGRQRFQKGVENVLAWGWGLLSICIQRMVQDGCGKMVYFDNFKTGVVSIRILWIGHNQLPSPVPTSKIWNHVSIGIERIIQNSGRKGVRRRHGAPLEARRAENQSQVPESIDFNEKTYREANLESGS